MNTPLVTVLMAVYNGEAYLGEAIESILRQTYSFYEFIIIDDASTDSSRRLAKSYQDPRICVVTNPCNLRLAASLNRGISLARGKYIVRMDADDISHPDRLEKQVAFMEENRDVGVSGSWLYCFGDKKQLWDYPLTPGMIKSNLLFYNQLGHPTVIMRREAMLKNGLFYNPRFRESEDYELWSRCLEHFSLANLPEVLLLYRWHKSQASQARLAEQRYYHSLVCGRMLKHLGIIPTPEEMELHLKIAFREFEPGLDFVKAARQWLLKIFRASFGNSYYPKLALGTVLENHWMKICLRAGISCPPLFD